MIAVVGEGCFRTATVRRHSSVTFSEADADAIFGEMTNLIAIDDGGDDFACAQELSTIPLNTLDPVLFALVSAEVPRRGGGNINNPPQPMIYGRRNAIFTFGGSANIMTPDDFNFVNGRASFVKVVNGIFVCGPQMSMTSFLGCTPTGAFNSMIVIDRPSNTDAAITWAHEWGHSVGNVDIGTARRIMNGFFASNLRRVNLDECIKYTNIIDPDGAAGALPRAAGQLPAPQNAGETAAPVAKMPPGMGLEEFVRSTPAHGIGYRIRDDLRPSDVALLARMLADPRNAADRDKILALLGLVGDSSVGRLIAEHIDRMRAAPMKWDRSNELTSGMLGLGALANHTGSREAVAKLRSWADAKAWKTEDPALAREIQMSAMMGLAMSGMPAAGAELRSMRAANRDRELAPRMQGVMDMFDKVSSQGLAEAMSPSGR